MGKTEILNAMIASRSTFYVVVETKFTEHHIEKLMASCRDRGTLKWIAETKLCYHDAVSTDQEAQRSHVDDKDCFPRFYFHVENFISEFMTWLKVRGLEITEIKAPKL